MAKEETVKAPVVYLKTLKTLKTSDNHSPQRDDTQYTQYSRSPIKEHTFDLTTAFNNVTHGANSSLGVQCRPQSTGIDEI